MSEAVLVVPRAVLGPIAQGFNHDYGERLSALIWNHVQWMDREQAETDERYRQLVAQCVLLTPEGVFGMERLAASGEARLHGRWSLLIGGHVNPEDLQDDPLGPEILWNAVLREMSEELVIVDGVELGLEFMGWLNDESDAVGRVHLGAIFRLVPWVAPENFQWQVRETTQHQGRMLQPAEVPTLPLESWSQIVWQVMQEEGWGEIFAEGAWSN